MANFGAARAEETVERRATDTTELASVLIRKLRGHHTKLAVPEILAVLQADGYLCFVQPLVPADARLLAEAIERAGFRIQPPARIG